MVIHVQGGKRRKDRDVMLSPKLLKELREHKRRLRPKPSQTAASHFAHLALACFTMRISRSASLQSVRNFFCLRRRVSRDSEDQKPRSRGKGAVDALLQVLP